MVSAILLGAGQSKRMGTDKLSLPWGRTTVFEHCLDVLLRSKVREVVVVLGGKNTEIESQIERKAGFRGKKVMVVRNPDYRRGMSSSIQKGIRSIDPGSHGILIALGDQPLLKTKTINALIDAFAQRKGCIVLPSYQGRRGHPVIFNRGLEKELLRLRGDVGGRSVIARHAEGVIELRTRSVAVVTDIDTWKQYKAQNSKLKAESSKGKEEKSLCGKL